VRWEEVATLWYWNRAAGPQRAGPAACGPAAHRGPTPASA